MLKKVEMKLNRRGLISPSWLKIVLMTTLAFGIFFRFVNLDTKPYWFDETSTSVELSGFSDAEVIQQIQNGRVIGIKDLEKYQYPSAEKTPLNMLENLASKEPQLSPLYFVLARFWVQWFGDSVAVTRSLSAAVSLLAFPCLYWLCLELFGVPLFGWLAIALVAISPFHVVYAQEARPYSLWIVAILLSNAALLRAVRRQTKGGWGIYAATVSLGLYTYLLSAFVFICHGIYVLVSERFRTSRTVIAYAFASLIGLSSFAPWIFCALVNLRKANDSRWGATGTPLFRLVKSWGRSISLFFVDFSLNDKSQLIYFVPFVIISLIVLILVGYSIYFLIRNAPQQVKLFILCQILVPALGLILPDFIFGGAQSAAARYLIPCYLSMQLSVVYLFAYQTCGNSIQFRHHRRWQVALLALISIGVLSCVDFSQSATWWNKAEGNANYYLAQIINRTRQPLLVSDTYFVKVMSLSHSLDRKAKFQLVVKPNIPKIPQGFSDIFLYDPSPTLQARLEKEYDLKPVTSGSNSYEADNYQPPALWRLVKR